jgi:hypothetical protein
LTAVQSTSLLCEGVFALNFYHLHTDEKTSGDSMRFVRMIIGCGVLGLVLAAAQGASAAQTLNYSYATTGVGSCDLHIIGCSPAHPAVYTKQTLQAGRNLNAASSASDPHWGAADASANPGTGPLALPELHSDVSGFPSGRGVPYSWNYSQVQGVMGLTALNAVAFDLHDFIGALHYSSTGTGVGLISASLAILDNRAGHFAVGNTYFAQDAAYGFLNTCSAPAALAIGETGNRAAKGTNLSLTVAPTICGASTVNLAAGESIYFWARMQTFDSAFSVIDASHTFQVELAPGLSSSVQNLTQNLAPITHFHSIVPEPATWAMMLIGLGSVGGAIRARRRTSALA